MLVLVTCVCRPHSHTHVFQICLLLISHSGTTAMSVIFLLAHTVFFSSFHFIPNKEFITAYGISTRHCVFNPSRSKEGTEQNNKTAFLTTSLNNEIRTCKWVHRPDHTMIKQISKATVEPSGRESVFPRVCFHLLVSAQTKMTHAIFYDVTLKFNKV